MSAKVQAKPFGIGSYSLIPGTEVYRKTVLNAEVLMNTDSDSLLYTFRLNAGLDTKGAVPLTGWETPGLHFCGQYMGHFLTACARSSISLSETDSELAAQLAEKAKKLVLDLGECQRKLGEKAAHFGYLSAVDEKMLDDLEALRFTGVYTVPYYNQHKIMSGLLDVWLLLGFAPALDIVKGMADYIEWRMSRLDDGRISAMLETRWYREDKEHFHMEFGGMHELLLRLYKACHERRYLKLAQRFDRKWFRRMLGGKRDLLGHYALHANTELPCVIGIAEYRELCSDAGETFESDAEELNMREEPAEEKDAGSQRDAEQAEQEVLNFMDWLQNGHLLPTGGVSGRPAYPAPADYGGELFEFAHMYYKHTNFKSGESCCSHNLNVLCRKLFSWTADARWAQEHERRYVNAVLAQQHPQNGGFVYNLRMGQGSRKEHSVDGFFCCNGTGIESHAWLTEGSFFHKDDTLWITNYVPCILHWKEQNVDVKMETAFPEDGKISVRFLLSGKKRLRVCVRIPDWTHGAQIHVNQLPAEVQNGMEPGSFAVIEREWDNGDLMELEFPFALRTERMEDRPEYTAVFYGPNLLVACAEAFASFHGTRRELEQALQPTGEPCSFSAELDGKNSVFRPICRVVDEAYNAYTIVTEPARFHQVDALTFFDEASEWEHQLELVCGAEGSDKRGAFRTAAYPGKLQCHFKTKPKTKLWLKLWVADTGVSDGRKERLPEYNQCFKLEVLEDRENLREYEAAKEQKEASESKRLKDRGNLQEDKASSCERGQQGKSGMAEEIAVQTLCETEDAELSCFYYPVMERNTGFTLELSGSMYEGEKRGIPKLYRGIELGYFEE